MPIIETVGIALTKLWSTCNTECGAKVTTDPGRGRRLIFAALFDICNYVNQGVLVHWGWNYLGPRLMPENNVQL